MEIKYNINFPQTFKPNTQYIGSILDIANTVKPLSVKDISSMTGIPQGEVSGKVEPHIYYANYMGLINYKKVQGLYELERTSLGETVSAEDPGLQEKLTILLCHAMILRTINGAKMWSDVFKKILPMYHTEIKKDTLIKELNVLFDGKISKKNIAPFFGSYEDMFSPIKILDLSDEAIKMNSTAYDKEFVFLYAYILWEYWDEIFEGQDEISSIQLEELCYGKAFGWDTKTEYSVLEHLTDKVLLRMNRQLMPYTLLKLVDKETLIKYLYSELC